MSYDSKVLARLIKAEKKGELFFERREGAEAIATKGWMVVADEFEELNVKVALYEVFGREIRKGECVKFTLDGVQPTGSILDFYEPEEAMEVGIMTPFIIGPSPEGRTSVQIANFGEQTADLYGVPVDFAALTWGKSVYRTQNENKPLYLGEEKQILVHPIKREWDQLIQKYAGIYRNKEVYIEIMNKEETTRTDIDEATYQQAKILVIQERQASVSFLQRKLRLGYVAAAKIVDRLELENIVGPFKGNQPREVLA